MPGTICYRDLYRLLALPLILVISQALHASELHGTGSLTSNYYWRGYSKSDEHLSAQLNLDFSSISDGSGYYLGTWLASVDFGDGSQDSNSDAELVLYGGWSQQLNDDFYLDLQLSHYLFSDKLFGKDADYSEFYVFLHYRDLITAEVAYAPDAYSMGDSTVNSQLTFRYPIHTYFDLSAGLGYYAARDLFDYDYAYWNAGVTWKLARFSLDLRFFSSRETNDKRYYTPYYQYTHYRQRKLPFSRATTAVTLTTGF